MMDEIITEVVSNLSSQGINVSREFVGGVVSGAVGGGVFAIIIASLILFSIFALGVYVYFAWANMVILKKLKYKNYWMSWIPFAQLIPFLQYGGFGWGWIFLILVPFFGWVPLLILVMIGMWRIFELRGYPGALSLIILGVLLNVLTVICFVGYAVVLGFVAWKDRKGNKIKIVVKSKVGKKVAKKSSVKKRVSKRR